MTAQHRRLIAPLTSLTLLGVFAALYCTYPNLYEHILTVYGFEPFRYPFIDAEFIGRGVECWNRGVNVYLGNPCDILNRPHSYSPLWLRATFLPTATEWTPAIGLTIDIAFILSLYAILRPETWRETLILTLCSISTMTAFAMERANVDILLFVMLAAALRAASGPLPSRAAAYALILFAGLLKFYPLVALVLLLRERPRLFTLFTAFALAVLLAFVHTYSSELAAIGRNIPLGPPTSDLFGASNLPNGLARLTADNPGDAAHANRLVKLLTWATLLPAAAALATAWVRNAALRQAFAALPPTDEITLVLGSVLVAGCFFTGQSVGYRGIDLIFVAAGLLALRRHAPGAAPSRLILSAIVTIPVLMWEGLVRTWLEKHPSLLVVWLLRELLWWYLAAILLAVVAIFIVQSKTATALAGRLPGSLLALPRSLTQPAAHPKPARTPAARTARPSAAAQSPPGPHRPASP